MIFVKDVNTYIKINEYSNVNTISSNSYSTRVGQGQKKKKSWTGAGRKERGRVIINYIPKK